MVLLGADTPLEELASAQRRAACEALVISSSIDPDPALFTHALPRLVREVGVPVFIGGPTALHHRRAITATGAHPVGTELEAGAAHIRTVLEQRRSAL